MFSEYFNPSLHPKVNLDITYSTDSVFYVSMCFTYKIKTKTDIFKGF